MVPAVGPAGFGVSVMVAVWLPGFCDRMAVLPSVIDIAEPAEVAVPDPGLSSQPVTESP